MRGIEVNSNAVSAPQMRGISKRIEHETNREQSTRVNGTSDHDVEAKSNLLKGLYVKILTKQRFLTVWTSMDPKLCALKRGK